MKRSTISRSAAIATIRTQWPDADEIRAEGKCHVCKRKDSMYSFQLESDHSRGKGEETCGFVCVACGWSNGGSRPSIDAAAPTTDGAS